MISSGHGTTSAKHNAKGKRALHRALHLSASSWALLTALAAAALVSSAAEAANYTASTEQELRDRIVDANADGDPSSTITLTGNITISDPAAFPAFTKPTTIDTDTFTLSGTDVASGTANGGSIIFGAGSQLTTDGTLTGGDADQNIAGGVRGRGGTGAQLSNGSLANLGSITGGIGAAGLTRYPGGGGGVGANLANSTLVNQGSIAGGQGGLNNANGSTGFGFTSNAGNGGAGLVMSGGSFDNQGQIAGGAGGDVLNVINNTDHFTAGAGGIGARLSGGTYVNGAAGTIIGGHGGSGGHWLNQRAGGGAGGAGLSLNGGGTFTNDGQIIGGDGGVDGANTAARGALGGAGAIVADSTITNNGLIRGGTSDGGRWAGSVLNGMGGSGLELTNSTATNAGTIEGGAGGAVSGIVGFGGTGLAIANSTITNSGTITGGAGGLSNGASVAGGVGISGTGGATIITSGIINGGMSGNGLTQNSAVAFTGGNNRLELHDGFDINGLVTATATDTLILGGTQDSTFAASDIGPAAQYRGFGRYQKTGSSTWLLTGTTTAVTPWELIGGKLSISQNASLGANTGRLTFSGGTLETTGVFTATRAMTINAPGGTFETNANLTVSGVIDGAGALTKTGAAKLTLTGANTYAGGTFINDGTVSVSADANLGNAAGPLIFGGGTLENTGAFASSRAVTLNAGGGTFETDATLTLNGVISGAGSLDKTGLGTLVLNGANTYDGPTTVSAGTLLVNGDQSGADGLTTVESGATLGGSGTVGGDVTIENGGILSPGDSITDPGELSIDGNLFLDPGAFLQFNFGQANIEGGALNDLVNVNGNLTLDGTLNVTTTPGGSFDTGVYRMFNYTGSLTNGGLAIGLIPSPNFYVQTSIDNQVNLVNTAGLALRFWDGDAGPKNDATPDGGDGLWQNFAGNDNWIEEGVPANAPFADSAFAVFAGAAGTVEVDDSLGVVNVSGMQFMTDDYFIVGDELNLVGAPWTDIRVGDGTAAGASVTATIDSVLTGTSGVNKTDVGTLILNGINTYSGGTRIGGGTLQISQDGNLGSGDLEFDGGVLQTTASFTMNRLLTASDGGGAISTDAATTLTLAGGLVGSGPLEKIGAGTVIQQGASTQIGTTTITQGTWQTGGANVLSGAGTYDVGAGGTLDLNGFDQAIAGLENAGTIRLDGGPGTTLSILGDYVGSGGTFYMNATLNDDLSPTDLLAIAGNTSGTSTLAVTNVGGAGAPTVEGIKLVDVAGTSAGTFSLLGNYVFEGDQAVVSGAYAYRLYQGSTSDPADGDWYLRSSLFAAVPLFQPGVPIYEAMPQVLLGLSDLPTLQQRVGNRYRGEAATAAPASSDDAGGNLFWGRIEASHSRLEPSSSTSDMAFDADEVEMQVGGDGLLSESEVGSLIAGITGQYGRVSADISSPHGDGEVETNGVGIGGTLTWYGAGGFYTDAQTQLTWFDNDLTSDAAGALADEADGFGYAFGLEAGQRIGIGGAWTLTPQAQLVYTAVDLGSFTDTFGTDISFEDAERLTGRLGLSLDQNTAWTDENGKLRRSSIYGIANLYYDFLNEGGVQVDTTQLETENEEFSGGIGVGGTYSWDDDRMAVYGQVTAISSLEDFGGDYSLGGTAGFRMKW